MLQSNQKQHTRNLCVYGIGPAFLGYEFAGVRHDFPVFHRFSYGNVDLLGLPSTCLL
ncbi:uncharacterized protein P174DRAFT_445567 [Aspergillus novofumigatus IBT 16806]|uniref:Uncharacterized protein n=1 Tax=Aspergillus novofumigatus (strain IBT 16806) TaxID=1392255 RepID=A0A2I1BWA1_ASPN1|nr:uncharacterized protein P174DRAFT_445567 [Aspergillus novofumigatus IBT 16806]PKX89659.1 hypothetical protein P174DRAFT_445567 [Aspergillus novofumigatus IBT 16806]